jgi:3-methyl-2-oxobutanoate hydroxymethyltransferase
MSVSPKAKRQTPSDIGARKGAVPLVCLTAYTTPMARLLDPIADLLLVGDSLGMVLYGFASTLPVTLDMMIAHAGAVMRGARQACVVVDLPWGSYQESPEQAYRHAARALAESGAAAVKIEGGEAMALTVRFLVERGVPVLGHVGLMPQSVNDSGFRVRGRTSAEAKRILEDARAVAAAGAFALVVEGTAEPVARAVTAAIAIPTIGIGASAACDGQILVTEDMLGLFSDFTPRFVKRYANLGAEIATAVAGYAEEVRSRRFPGPEHIYEAAAPPKKAKPAVG